MGRISMTQLAVTFLLTAALCLEATLKYSLYLTDKMSWAEARQHCQRKYEDLATWHALNRKNLTVLATDNPVWIGLFRDQEQDSVWRWINLVSGSGTTGEDVSRGSRWAAGESSPHCGALDEDVLIHSQPCLKEMSFYCSEGGQVTLYNNALTWDEASLFCQERNGHLATINQVDLQESHSPGWIGLYRIGGDNWRWVDNVPSNHLTWWGAGGPRHLDCGAASPATEKFHSEWCNVSQKAACFTDNLVVVNESKTWEEAVKQCRDMEVTCTSPQLHCKHNYDLLSLVHFSDYTYVRIKMAKAHIDEVWTGLRFLGGHWWWLNGKQVKDKDMLPGCPPQWKHCGLLSRRNNHSWAIADCSERRPFFCVRLR